MIMVNTHEAKTKLSKLLKLVETKHEKVRICRNGKAIADLVEPEGLDNDINFLKSHPVLSNIIIDYDATEPLAEDEWPEDCK